MDIRPVWRGVRLVVAAKTEVAVRGGDSEGDKRRGILYSRTTRLTSGLEVRRGREADGGAPRHKDLHSSPPTTRQRSGLPSSCRVAHFPGHWRINKGILKQRVGDVFPEATGFHRHGHRLIS